MNPLRLLAAVLLISTAVAACAAVRADEARRALAVGNLDEAAAQVRAALASNPDDLVLKELAADIFTRRGAEYYQKGAYIQAAQDLNTAVGYYPTYARAYEYLGLIAFAQNNWSQAIDYGTRAAQLSGGREPSYVADARRQVARIREGRAPLAAPLITPR
jgi:tetratricopeptide (TPR) repeat protein